MLFSKPVQWFRCLCLLACALIPSLAAHAQIPTPASVLGHTPGDDFFLADYADTIRYFHALASASDRIKMFTVGKSTQGKDIEIAVTTAVGRHRIAMSEIWVGSDRRLVPGSIKFRFEGVRPWHDHHSAKMAVYMMK